MLRRNSLLGIGNRDILQTNWEQRVARAIQNNNYYQFEYAHYGTKIIKTDSKLLKAFCNSSFDMMGLENTEEVYLIMCINEYLPDSKKYHSKFRWEEHLRNEGDN